MQVDCLVVTHVFYHGATPVGNYEYYHSISQEVDLPIIIYNVIPTNQITPKAMLKLSEIEKVVGIKQVDINTLPEMVSFCGDRINIYSVYNNMLYSTYVSGACGELLQFNYCSKSMCKTEKRAFENGDQKAAMEINKKIFYINKAYNLKPFLGKTKDILNELEKKEGKCRNPTFRTG